MEACLDILKSSKNEIDAIKELKNFNEDFKSTFSFDQIDVYMRKEFIDVILKELSERSRSRDFQVQALCALRILSRDKNGLGLLTSEQSCKTLFTLSGLHIESAEKDQEDKSGENGEASVEGAAAREEVAVCNLESEECDQGGRQIMDIEAVKESCDIVIEALKCLCNIIFQSKTARDHCLQFHITEALVRRIKNWFLNPEFPGDVKYFDLRMLFLLTAYEASERTLVVNSNGVCVLTHCLDANVPRKADRDRVHSTGAKDGCGEVEQEVLEKMSVLQRFMIEKSPTTYDMDEDQIGLVTEILKVLFNVTMALPKEMDNDTLEHYERIALIVCSIFTHNKKIVHGTESIHNQAINILSSLPKQALKFIVWKVPKLIGRAFKAHYDLSIITPQFRTYYMCYNMYAVHAILAILDQRLTHKDERDSLISILSALSCAARGNRIIRKYLKLEILPPLGKVTHKRPEEGNKIRNKLVKLMTSPVTDLADLAAEFLFILCKENADRLIKYSGYGNAAGLLARRGLCCRSEEGDYSSEDEESDTEEYLEVKDQIDPVLGAIPFDRPNPLDSMSEEEKEEEAEKLRNLIIELNNLGVIRTAKVGHDGKPVATSDGPEAQEKIMSEEDHTTQ